MVALLLFALGAARGEELTLIVHPDVPVESLQAEDLRDIYLLRRTTWPDGQAIIPVNLPATERLRRILFKNVVGITNQAAVQFWARAHFQGRQPPHVVASERAAVVFVSRVPGAIAYVPDNLALDGVKAVSHLSLEESEP